MLQPVDVFVGLGILLACSIGAAFHLADVIGKRRELARHREIRELSEKLRELAQSEEPRP